MKHKSTQPLYIFNRENPQNSEPQNGPRSGLDYIALNQTTLDSRKEKWGFLVGPMCGEPILDAVNDPLRLAIFTKAM